MLIDMNNVVKRLFLSVAALLLVFASQGQSGRVVMDKSVSTGSVSIDMTLKTLAKGASEASVGLIGSTGRVTTLKLNGDGTMSLDSGGNDFVLPTKPNKEYRIKIDVDIEKKQVQLSYGLIGKTMTPLSATGAELTFSDRATTDAYCLEFSGVEPKDVVIDVSDNSGSDIWKQLSKEDIDKYNKWVATLPEEQMQWELALQRHLGGAFYFPRYVKARNKGVYSLSNPDDWGFVVDNPSLPRVLLVGDSISRGYTVGVRNKLKGDVNLHRAPANCGSSAKGVVMIDDWSGKKSWDIVCFNFGIHDVAQKIDSAKYAANLEKIIALLKVKSKKLIWVSTTPEYIKETNIDKCDKINRVAAAVMRKHGIPVSDINKALKSAPNHKALFTDGVHVNDVGSEILASTVAKTIADNLK